SARGADRCNFPRLVPPPVGGRGAALARLRRGADITSAMGGIQLHLAARPRRRRTGTARTRRGVRARGAGKPVFGADARRRDPAAERWLAAAAPKIDRR